MKKSSLIGGIIALAIIATWAKWAINAFAFDNGVAWNDPQASVLLSHAAGVFVSPAKAQPNEFEWKDTHISFNEIWVERQVKTTFPYVWLYYLKPSGKNILCFTLSEGKEIFINPRGPFFRVNGTNDKGFTMVGNGKLFYCELSPDDFAAHKMEISMIQNWKDNGGQPIEFTW